MTKEQVIVGWIGVGLILLNLFLTDQWSIIWGSTIGAGSFHVNNFGQETQHGLNPATALPGGTGPLPSASGKQKKPVGEK